MTKFYIQFDGVDIGELQASNKKMAIKKAILKYKGLFDALTLKELRGDD
jgi:hypothetical protein